MSTSLRSERLEVVGTRKNGRARGACLLRARPFSLSPSVNLSYGSFFTQVFLVWFHSSTRFTWQFCWSIVNWGMKQVTAASTEQAGTNTVDACPTAFCLKYFRVFLSISIFLLKRLCFITAERYLYLVGSSNGFFDPIFARRPETMWSILIIYYMISKKGVLLACRASVVWQSAK